MTTACDELTPSGCPDPAGGMGGKSRWSRPECRVRVLGGALVLDLVLDKIKVEIYEYNTRISKTGYYLKPVHRVYRKTGGQRKVYEYYGRYWWRLERSKGRLKWIYVGRIKPEGLPEPPRHVLEGLSVIREGEDVIIECSLYDKFRTLFDGFPVERA